MNKDTFESLLYKSDTGCWLWVKCKLSFGYGQLRVSGSRILAHRYAYTLYIGPIPEGMLILHKCDVPNCVNPEHLFLGTTQDNTADMMVKNRVGNRGRPTGTGRFMPKNT